MGGFELLRAITPGNGQTAAGDSSAQAVREALARDDVAALAGSEWSPPLVSGRDADRGALLVPAPASAKKRQLALDLMRCSRREGLPFSFLACGGAYGHLPWLAHELDSVGETFVAEVHRDRAVYLEDPTHVSPGGRLPMFRASLRLREKVAPTSVIAWISVQPPAEWRRLRIEDGENRRRKARADFLTRRVWIWDGQPGFADHWHLLVRREMDGATLRSCLSNAGPDASLRQLAEMHARCISSSLLSRTQVARTAWQW